MTTCRRIIVSFILCIFLSFGVAFAQSDRGISERAVVNARPVLVFTTFPSAGYSEIFRRLLTEAYDRIGYDVIIERMPAERALVISDSGQVDGEAGRLSIIENSFHNLIRVPTPFFHTKTMVWAKQDDLDISGGWDALKKYKLGTLQGYKYVESKTFDMNRVLVPTHDKLFEMLEAGRLDIVILSLFDALPVIRAMALPDINQLEPPLGEFPMYHYLHKKHAALVPVIDKAFEEMRLEGRLDAIVAQALHELGGD